MENDSRILVYHKGRKIERIRKLRGMTQTELANRIGNGVTKQAVSKLERSENISDEKLNEVADALGVTFEGLKSFSEDKVLYNTVHIYENSQLTTNHVAANIETVNNHPIKETVDFFEKQLQILREELKEILKEKRK